MANNLTRDEARDRADLITVQSYEISLDLTGGEITFRSDTTITFTAAQPGAATFVDLVAPEVREITLNGAPVDLTAAVGDRILLTGLEEGTMSCGSSPTAPTPAPARACTGSPTRRTRASTCTPTWRRSTRTGSTPASTSPT